MDNNDDCLGKLHEIQGIMNEFENDVRTDKGNSILAALYDTAVFDADDDTLNALQAKCTVKNNNEKNYFILDGRI